MRYSMVTMRQAIQELGVTKGISPFVGDKPGQAQPVHPQLAEQFKYGRGQNFLNDVLEYCWLAYSKALNAAGPQLVGRQGDLWIDRYLTPAGMQNKQPLWDPQTKGTILSVDKWAPVVNDCWVLGGVHRLADFQLVSIRSVQNLWNFKDNLPVVTAREILGLLNFGYSFDQKPDVVKLVCTDKGKAQQATIRSYDALMKGRGVELVRSLLEPRLKNLLNEIAGFDRSRLKHVPPPR